MSFVLVFIRLEIILKVYRLPPLSDWKELEDGKYNLLLDFPVTVSICFKLCFVWRFYVMSQKATSWNVVCQNISVAVTQGQAT